MLSRAEPKDGPRTALGLKAFFARNNLHMARQDDATAVRRSVPNVERRRSHNALRIKVLNLAALDKCICQPPPKQTRSCLQLLYYQQRSVYIDPGLRLQHGSTTRGCQVATLQ